MAETNAPNMADGFGNSIRMDESGINLTAGKATPRFFLTNLPTADPHVVGALWSNSGVVTVSAG